MVEIADLIDALDVAVEARLLAREQLVCAEARANAADHRHYKALRALESQLVEVLGTGIVAFFYQVVPLDEEDGLRMLTWLVTGQASITVPLIEDWIELEICRSDEGGLVYRICRLPRAVQYGAQLGIEETMRGKEADLRRFLGGEAIVEVDT